MQYLIRFGDKAILAEDIGRISPNSYLGHRYELLDIDDDKHFKTLCKKYKDAIKLDYFKGKKLNLIPNYILEKKEIIQIITQYQRNQKLNDIL
jgi:hypothetical protein